MEKSTRQIGSFGELLAQKFLEKKDYKILAKNWTCRYGEIDLIGFYGKKIVFVEVKYVQSDRFCHAVSLNTTKKRKNLMRAINIFVSRYPKIRDKWQLDLVCVTKDSDKFWIEHYLGV